MYASLCIFWIGCHNCICMHVYFYFGLFVTIASIRLHLNWFFKVCVYILNRFECVRMFVHRNILLKHTGISYFHRKE